MSGGIFHTFSSRTSKRRSFAINHSQKKMDKMKLIFPISKYQLKTKENFILANLYVNFKENPSSLMGAIKKLEDLKDSDVLIFKNEIVNYRKFLKDDIERIKIQGNKVSLDYMLREYKKGKIYWFTFYFYLEASQDPNATLENLKKSRINIMLIQRIEKLLLYVSFSKESRELIKKLMQDKIDI